MHRQKRRFAAGSIGGLAVVLAVASAAWACTVFYGNMTISGNGTGNAQSTVSGDPGSNAVWNPPTSTNGQFMNWCGYSNFYDEGAGWWSATVNQSSPQLTVSVAPNSTNCQYAGVTNKLPAGDYVLAVHHNFLPEGGGGNPDHNCHGANQLTTLDATFSVSAAGTGGGTYSGFSLSGGGSSWWSVCAFLESSNQFAPAIASNFQAV